MRAATVCLFQLLCACAVLLSPARAADPLASYYGTYTSLFSDLQACETMANGACASSCCPLNYTLQQTSSPSIPNLIVFYAPSTLSRCSGGSAGPYETSLTLSTDANGNTVGSGTISVQPLVLTFGIGQTFTAVIGSASPQCALRTNTRQQSTTTDVQTSTSAAVSWSLASACVIASVLLVLV